MVGVAEVIAWREELIKAALQLLCAERALSDEDASAKAVMDAEDRLTLAARDLARAVDQLPVARRPKGWGAVA